MTSVNHVVVGGRVFMVVANTLSKRQVTVQSTKTGIGVVKLLHFQPTYGSTTSSRTVLFIISEKEKGEKYGREETL